MSDGQEASELFVSMILASSILIGVMVALVVIGVLVYRGTTEEPFESKKSV